jgi:hypothetical protein
MADKQVVDLIHVIDKRITSLSNTLRALVEGEQHTYQESTSPATASYKTPSFQLIADILQVQIGLMIIIKAIVDVD